MSHYIIREGRKLHTIYFLAINHSEKKVTPSIYYIDTYTYNKKKLIKIAKRTIRKRKDLSKYYKNKGYRFVMYTEYIEAKDDYDWTMNNLNYKQDV